MRCVVLSFIAEPMVEGAAPLQLQGKMGRIRYRQGSNFSAQREIARRVEGPAITGGVRMTGACDFRWRVQECAAGPTDGDGRDLRYRRDGGVGDRLPHVSRSIPFESPVQDAPRAPLKFDPSSIRKLRFGSCIEPGAYTLSQDPWCRASKFFHVSNGSCADYVANLRDINISQAFMQSGRRLLAGGR